MGLAVAPKLKRSSWIQWKTNLERNNKTDTNFIETNFIVVRHPFERLVSAYRDKLERSHEDNYQKDFYYKTTVQDLGLLGAIRVSRFSPFCHDNKLSSSNQG